MSNREKIIVVGAVLALIYGVYIVFLEPSAKQPTFSTSSNQLDNLNTFITKVAAATKEGISERDSEIITRAEKAWVRDPLVRMRKPVQDEEETEQAKQETQPEGMIIYTGYLEMGTTRLAIINGNEYATKWIIPETRFSNIMKSCWGFMLLFSIINLLITLIILK